MPDLECHLGNYRNKKVRKNMHKYVKLQCSKQNMLGTGSVRNYVE
jgi:hypothetical protein